MALASTIKVVLPISVEHAAFGGHFPGAPVVPAVVLLDETLHAIEAYMQHQPACWRIVSAKFHSPVEPGEAVLLEYLESDHAVFRFTLHVQERLIASGTVSVRA